MDPVVIPRSLSFEILFSIERCAHKVADIFRILDEQLNKVYTLGVRIFKFLFTPWECH